MKLQRLYLFFCIIFFASLAKGQVKSFSLDPSVYIVELSGFMKETKIESANKAQEAFAEVWKSGVFDELRQKQIIKLSNEMLVRKMRVSPDFELLTNTLVSFAKSKQVENKFPQWYPVLDKILKENDKKRYTDFLQASYWLFNEGAIYISDSKKWLINSNEYEFSYKDYPAIQFKSIEFECRTQGDKMLISQTTGNYNIDKNLWIGKGGKVNWARVGIDTVFCELKNYKIDITKAEYEADSVLFTHKEYFKTPILGKLIDKAVQSGSSEDVKELASYPYFTSYQKDLAINQFGSKETKYNGGFGMKGTKILATGTEDQKAFFSFYYKNKQTVKVASTEFVVTKTNILTDKAEFTIMIDTFKMYHPRVQFNYLVIEKKMVVSRGKEGITAAPFFDDYHRLEILCDQIKWSLEEPKIEMEMVTNDATAIFESGNYFKDFRYEKVQGLLAYNPLSRVQQYCVKNDTREFQLDAYAASVGSNKEFLKPQMIQLADLGFIFYYPEREKVIVRPKLMDYVNSHFGRTDYDVLRFTSVISARSNANLNLINNNLTLEGIRVFHFSDSQEVYVVPTEQTIIVKKNRNMEFGGKIKAGRFDFYAKKYEFNYQNFKIDYTKIDSMKIYYPDTNNRGNVAIKSVLKDLYGTLYIDKPYNKSGRKNFPEYPIFVSEKASKVSYEAPHIHGGAYKEDDFRFDVDPFTIDSLDNFTIEGLQFDGTFVSAGIFPDFRYKVSIQKDYSLGFVTSTPSGGYPMYQGAGKGNMEISLSNQGLWGNGQVEYVGSITKSDKFLMLPKEMLSESKSFELASTSLYPEVKARDIHTHWRPYQDSMYINMKKEPMDVFKNGSKLTGNLVLTSKGLSGTGSVKWSDAELISKDIKFGTNKMDANSAAIIINAIDPGKIALKSMDVKAHVDFDKSIGDFRSNIPGQLTSFPMNMYSTSMDEFKWNMLPKTIAFKNSPNLQPERSYMLSNLYEQDSLRFGSTDALFDMNTSLLFANKIPFIMVADAKIFPDSAKVVIETNALMRTLRKAKIITDTVHKYHNIFDVTLNVLGRKKMTGNGYYEYVDKQKKKQGIYFDQIYVNKDIKTAAKGYIADTTNFTLTQKIVFKGYPELLSTEKFLSFEGFVSPKHQFEHPVSQWLRYSGRINPDSVVIPAGDPKGEDNKALSVGINLANDSMHLYSTFFSRKRNYSDAEVMVDTGIFYYDDNLEEFRVGNRDKLSGKSLKGNYISYSDKKGLIYSEGKIKMGVDFGKVELTTAGSISKEKGDSTFTMDMVMLWDFVLPDEAMKELGDFILANSDIGASTKNSRPLLKTALAEIVEEKNQKKVFEELSSYGSIKMVNELEKTLFFSEAKFTWDNARKSYIMNDQVGLTSVGKQKIDRKLKAIIEIQKKRSGDNFNMYLEVSKFDWIFINYVRGVLTISTSNDKFNKIITEKGGKIKVSDYKLRLGTERSKTNFIKKFD